jgi:hypothetical protein
VEDSAKGGIVNPSIWSRQAVPMLVNGEQVTDAERDETGSVAGGIRTRLQPVKP